MAVSAKAAAIFLVLDTDKNGLIDALEFTSTIAALSGMRLREILEFILTSYDFDGSQQLSIDEVTLALKSLSSGLCKVSNLVPPREELIELLVSTMFFDCTGSETTDLLRLRVSVLAEHLNSHPDIRSWFAFYGSPSQTGLQAHEVLESEKDYDSENITVLRGDKYTQAVEWNLRCKTVPPAPEPWLQTVTMLTPMEYATAATKKLPPDASVSLEWVFGYQSEKCRNNVLYNFRGDVVYNVSKYVISYSFMDHQQSVFSGHTDEVACLAVHPEGQLIASGDVGPKPRLLVWHAVTHEILFADRSFHRNGIIHTAFSHDGRLLAAIGNDASHMLAVYHWAENKVVFTSLVSQGPCYGCCFRLDGAVAVGGDSYLFIWERSPEGYIKKRGNFSSYTAVEPITCLVAVEGTGADSLITGTVSGHLFLWIDKNCLRAVKAHQVLKISTNY
jgi:microtubule-associated protein-like 6